jgi:hypothetical protein
MWERVRTKTMTAMFAVSRPTLMWRRSVTASVAAQAVRQVHVVPKTIRQSR